MWDYQGVGSRLREFRVVGFRVTYQGFGFGGRFGLRVSRYLGFRVQGRVY